MHSQPKKRLGQNFLVDKNIQRKIVTTCCLSGSDRVLEIGSGKGAITGLIAKQVKKVWALEIDSRLCSELKKNLVGSPNAEVINQDILFFNLKKYFKSLPDKIKVIGNIPYYISSPIIEYLIKERERIDTIFLTVQKEFGRRIIAGPGSKDYGSFSCFVQYYLEPKVLFDIKKTCFYPQPKVDSSFIRFKVREEAPVKVADEELFFRVIRAAFNKRRKTLKNSLKNVIPEVKLELFFSQNGITPKIRPESLKLQDFATLINT